MHSIVCPGAKEIASKANKRGLMVANEDRAYADSCPVAKGNGVLDRGNRRGAAIVSQRDRTVDEERCKNTRGFGQLPRYKCTIQVVRMLDGAGGLSHGVVHWFGLFRCWMRL